MKEFQIIRSMNDANKLLGLGHQIKKIDRDINNREYLVFWFKNSNQLQQNLKEISK